MRTGARMCTSCCDCSGGRVCIRCIVQTTCFVNLAILSTPVSVFFMHRYIALLCKGYVKGMVCRIV